MDHLSLELNDAGILSFKGPSHSITDLGPGYALYEDGHFVYGQEAYERARLKPRWTCNWYWRDMGSQPLGRPFPRSLTHADLVHGQLTHLALHFENRPLIMALPDTFQKPQLALLLGILQAGGITARAMTTTALASAASAANKIKPGPLVHLEMTLHGPIKTTLIATRANQKELTLEQHNVKALQAPGLKHLLEIWTQTIARRFVQETRFDPLHSAQSEQTIFSNLPKWLEALQTQSYIEIAMDSGARRYHIKIHRTDLVEAARESYQAILNRAQLSEPATPVLLSHRLAELPGFIEMADVENIPVTLIAKEACVKTLYELGKHLKDAASPALKLTVEAQAPQTPKAKPALKKPRPLPTHLLYDGQAHPLPRES